MARSLVVTLAIVGFELTLVPIAWILARLTGQGPPWAQLSLRSTPIALGFAATLPMLPILYAIAQPRWKAFREIRVILDQGLRKLLDRCSLVELAAIAIAAGVGEELFFRGWLQPALSTVSSTTFALIVASLVFGLVHAVTPMYAVLASAIGVYFGLLLIFTGDLIVPVVCHSAYDLIALTFWLRVLPDTQPVGREPLTPPLGGPRHEPTEP